MTRQWRTRCNSLKSFNQLTLLKLSLFLSQDMAIGWMKESSLVFPFLHLEGPFKADMDAPLQRQVLQALQGAIILLHDASVVHMDLYPCNVMWEVGAYCAVVIRLIDFDASLVTGTAIPARAASIIEHNGHMGSYHPDVFNAREVAHPKFDWWLFAMMVYPAPFSSPDLPQWREYNTDKVLRLTQHVC
jgi:serine/threonine protein kinase